MFFSLTAQESRVFPCRPHDSPDFHLIQIYTKIKTERQAVSPFCIHLRVSDVLNGLGRALSCAGTALQALALVDLIVDIAHLDSLSRALSRAGTAGQALVGNNKSHDIPSIQNNSDSGRAGSARHISLSDLL
jgi:hypothetical protein